METETKDAYKHLDKETLEVASVVMDMPEIWEHRDEYQESMEEYDMCKAIRGLMADSKAEGRQEGQQQECVTNIRNLMETLQLSVEQAMNALLIPEEERDKYRTLL